MSRFASRRRLAVLLVVDRTRRSFSSTAVALPSSGLERLELAASARADLFARLREWLVAIWAEEGCVIDPSGRCVTKSNATPTTDSPAGRLSERVEGCGSTRAANPACNAAGRRTIAGRPVEVGGQLDEGTEEAPGALRVEPVRPDARQELLLEPPVLGEELGGERIVLADLDRRRQLRSGRQVDVEVLLVHQHGGRQEVAEEERRHHPRRLADRRPRRRPRGRCGCRAVPRAALPRSGPGPCGSRSGRRRPSASSRPNSSRNSGDRAQKLAKREQA